MLLSYVHTSISLSVHVLLFFPVIYCPIISYPVQNGPTVISFPVIFSYLFCFSFLILYCPVLSFHVPYSPVLLSFPLTSRPVIFCSFVPIILFSLVLSSPVFYVLSCAMFFSHVLFCSLVYYPVFFSSSFFSHFLSCPVLCRTSCPVLSYPVVFCPVFSLSFNVLSFSFLSIHILFCLPIRYNSFVCFFLTFRLFPSCSFTREDIGTKLTKTY